jgi:ABC-type nickel/cobalt efflux system permease component RcnA
VVAPADYPDATQQARHQPAYTGRSPKTEPAMNVRFALLLVLFLASPAAAHPLPNMRYDRTVAVRLTPDAVVVKYTLEVGWFTMHLDGAKLLTPDEIAQLDKTEKGFAAVYARKIAPQIAADLRAVADGTPLALRVEKVEIDILDHLKCNFTFKAEWPAGGRKRVFAFDDESLEGKPGVLNLTLDRADISSGVNLDITEEPPAGLRNRPTIELKPGEEKKLRRASAEVELPREIGPPASDPQPAAEPVVTVTDAEKPSLWGDLRRRGLPALFDSRFGVGVLLLAAFLFGAAHAFTPGHGKTLVAAYLVGERGTVKHAVILAVATTVAHTGSVIAIAAILWGVYGNNVPGTAQGVLQFAGGFLVAGVGLWLLMRRVAGKADHLHLGAGHHHPHDHGHSHDHHHAPPPDAAKTTGGWTRLVLMGLGGGIVPCWDAVLLLIAATSLNQVGFAVPLLFAFSAGLGAVLVLLGVGVVWAHKRGAVKFQESRWFRALPLVSAVLLVAVGFWLCQEGLRAAVR